MNSDAWPSLTHSMRDAPVSEARRPSGAPYGRPARRARVLRGPLRLARERVRAGADSYLALQMGNGFGGGIVECGTGRPLWLPYVEVSGIVETTERARNLGASVLLEPREGPAGWRSVVAAPAGGEIAFWQPKPDR